MEITALYNQFHKHLYNYIALRINNKQDVEDLLQDVFVKLFLNLKKLEHGEKLNSWVFTITRNSITDYYRRNSSLKNKTNTLDEQVMDQFSPEEEMDTTKGLDQCLKSFIQQLPEKYRAIIIDSEINGIRQKELAVKYDMAYPTLRSTVQRGRTKLKYLLEKCCKVESDKHGNILESTPQHSNDSSCKVC